ncbi:MAG: c-type cytochrome [Chitinophagaceae bacterium]
MKRILLVAIPLLLFIACNSDSKKVKVDPTPTLSQTNNSVDILVDTLGYVVDSSMTKFEEGISLITQSDCLGCHKVKEQSVGPSYTAVAEKYPANAKNISYLVSKIISGGKGVWGEVPMAAHASLSEADATEMVKYILSLKGTK